MILSISRRTDIPGYYSQWFVNRLKAGYVYTKNPMNPLQMRKILLSPEDIDCIVFWTKDPQNMMDKLSVIDDLGYSYYFQFTLNPYRKDMERNLREKDQIVCTFRKLSNQLGHGRVLWRYDPIILNDNITFDYHICNFEQLCNSLQGYTKICTISFVDIYSKLNKQVKQNIIQNITKEQMHQLAAGLSEIAKNYGIELRACCETLDLSTDGVKPAACIDKEIVERVCGHTISVKTDKNQRPGCNCIQSVDIGIYNTCNNGCVYCYANYSEASIRRNFEKHDPNSDIMIGRVD